MEFIYKNGIYLQKPNCFWATMTVITDDETNQITFEEVYQMLDEADGMYLDDKTFSSLLARLNVYITTIPHLLFDDRAVQLARFLKIFTCGDLIAYNMVSSNSNFRNTLLLKANEMGDTYSDQLEVTELLDQVENIKHIIDEIENDNEEDEPQFGEVEDESECECSVGDNSLLFTDSSDEDIF